MRKPLQWLASAFIVSALSGCATFSYDNVTYPSRSAAYQAARNDVLSNVSNIKPQSDRLGGSALIVIPTREIIKEHGVTRTGNTNKEMIEYVSDVLELGFISMADVVKRGNIFDSVSVRRSADTENYPFNGYDYKLWLVGKGPTSWKWYLRDNSGKVSAVHMNSKLSGTHRLEAFNSSLVSAKRSKQPSTEHAESSDSDRREQPQLISSGTAFFVNKHGFAITNAHVVNECTALRLESATLGAREASITAIDQRNDLALLKTQKTGTISANLRTTQSIRLGEHIVVFGFPLAGALASGGNLTTGVVSALSGLADDSRIIQISAPVQPGNSGGPVIDELGNVIGVVVSKLNAINTARYTGDIPQNVNFAIKASVVISFLDAHGISFETSKSIKKISAADIGDIAKTMTHRVICTQ